MIQPKETEKLPNAEGWWARNDSGRVKWFFVDMVDEMGASIYVSDLNDLLPVKQFHKPLMRWCGPFNLPWDNE